jgi:POT family proton-dependent oligopeptide transporter
LFTDRDVARTMFGWTIPAPEFASLNGAFIILLAPLLAFLWPWLAGRGIRVGDLLKIALGLAFIGLAYLLLRLGIFATSSGAGTNLSWIVSFFFVLTVAELCLSPIGLALTTALAPRSLSGFAMGIWFIAVAAASYLSGLLAQLSDVPAGTGTAEEVGIYGYAFLVYGAIGIVAAVLFLVFVPALGRMASAGSARRR